MRKLDKTKREKKVTERKFSHNSHLVKIPFPFYVACILAAVCSKCFVGQSKSDLFLSSDGIFFFA